MQQITKPQHRKWEVYRGRIEGRKEARTRGRCDFRRSHLRRWFLVSATGDTQTDRHAVKESQVSNSVQFVYKCNGSQWEEASQVLASFLPLIGCCHQSGISTSEEKSGEVKLSERGGLIKKKEEEWWELVSLCHSGGAAALTPSFSSPFITGVEEMEEEEASAAAKEEEVERGSGGLMFRSTGVSVISTSACSSGNMGIRARGAGGGRCADVGAALLLLLLGLGAFWITSTIGVRPDAVNSQLGFWSSSTGRVWWSDSDAPPGWHCTTTPRCSDTVGSWLRTSPCWSWITSSSTGCEEEDEDEEEAFWMTPPVTEVMIEVGGGGAGCGGCAGREAGGAGRLSSGRCFLGRPRFRFTGGALTAEPTDPPAALLPGATTSGGRLLVFPRAFCTTEVGAAGAWCCWVGGGGGGCGGGGATSLSYDRQPWGRIITGRGAPCCWGSVAMAMTLTPPALALAAAAGPPGPDAPTTPEGSLGASEGGEEVLSEMELRGRILGNCFMKASTCGTESHSGY